MLMKKQTPKIDSYCNDLITVIVPVYNDTAENLKACLVSICSSTYKALEIIIVDDGSEPALSEKYRLLCNKTSDNRLRYIYNSHFGAGMARQAGIKIATGTYIAFCDSDDKVDPDMYFQLALQCKKKQADAAFGLLAYTDNKKTKIFKDLTEAEYFQNDITNELIPLLLGYDRQGRIMHASVCRAIYKKEIITCYDVCFSQLCFSEDLFFNLNFLVNCNHVVTTEKLCYYYNVNTNSVTNSYNADRFDKTLLVYNSLLIWIKKYNLHQENNKSRIAAWFISQLSVIIKNEILLNPDKHIADKRLFAYINSQDVKAALKMLKIKKPFSLLIFSILMKLRQKHLLKLAIKIIYNS